MDFFTITTLSIYSIITLVILVGLYNGLSQVCYQVKAEQQRINNIAFLTKRELLALARDYKVVGYSKYNKYQLSNYLIEALA